MWNRILGKANDAEKNPSTHESRRKSESQHSTPRRSDSQKSTASSRKRTQPEERDRGFNPTSTSYSSTTQNQYPGTASASIGSSFATASTNLANDPYLPPGLVRNASLANQIPTASATDGKRGAALDSASVLEEQKEELSSMDWKRDQRERRGTRDKDDDRESRGSRDKKSRRETGGITERAMSTDEAAYARNGRSDRAVTGSEGPNGSSSSMPLAGQHEVSRPGPQPEQHHSQSSHIQDQFPGQFSTYAATPYRPPLAVSEGGPGLAAEYYGDAGQSVADQPGFRIQSPSLIVGAEPHLQAASVVAAPPPEPSVSGGVGAAASFYEGSFNAGSDVESHHGQKPSSTNVSSAPQYNSAAPPTTAYPTSSSSTINHHSSSAPIVPTLGAAAAGTAAGYYMSHRPSKPESSEHASSSISGYGNITGSSNYQQSGGAHDQYTSYSSSTRPLAKPGKHSSQSSNIPLYAAGAAGLAATAYHHSHHDSSQHHSNGQHYTGNSMAQQHRHRHQGPLSKLVDFFKDPEGVAQFEEYTEYIGVCRYCFAPGSSPRDAPRRHHYRRRRSNERFGSSVRVDKDSRYWSSENENRRRKNRSWLEAGIAGYGLGKLGENLFKQGLDFDDPHSVHSGTVTKSHRRRGSSSSLEKRRRSKDRKETGITSDGKFYRKDSHGQIHTSSMKVGDSNNHSHHSRSQSRDRSDRVSEAVLGATAGSSVIASLSRRRSRSPKKAFVRSKYNNEADNELASVLRLHDSVSHEDGHHSHHSSDPKHRKGPKKEKKSRGFFSFSNGSSSSSSSSNLAFGAELERKRSRNTKSKRKDKRSREPDAALLGLGAAAAALALSQNQRSKHKGELVAVKESKGKNKPGNHAHRRKESSSGSEEDLWESASEGDWSSADSELAYGASLHRRSRESLSSDSSGLDKWTWRWGSKKEDKNKMKDRRRSSGVDHISPAAGTPSLAADATQVPLDRNRQESRMTSSSSIPLQHVYPMPTSDPTQFDVARHDSGAPLTQSYISARPEPVPIQHPQPVAPVSSAVYTTQSPYSHSYSAPSGPTMASGYSNPPIIARERKPAEVSYDDVPGAFPTGSEYFQSFMQDSKKESKPRRRDSSPVNRTSAYDSVPSGPRRRKSLKDDSSSVRFDLTKEQEDKDRREERRRRKEEDRRRERLELERQKADERKPSQYQPQEIQEPAPKDRPTRSRRTFEEEPTDIHRETWAAPAAAGVIAAAIGATVAARNSGEDEHRVRHDEKRRDREDRDIEVIVKERHAPADDAAKEETDGRDRSSKREGMSVWQAAAKLKRSSSHTEYAAYFTPPELLSKSSDVKQAVGANADNDITLYQVPNVVTVEPSEPLGHSPSRVYSFPIVSEDVEHGKKPLPWSVPQLNLVEPTPPSSRAGSVAGSHSPGSRSPLVSEVPVADIPLEPLESVIDPSTTYAEPEHVEYTVIEPKDPGMSLVDSPTSETNFSDAVPGISSLKNRKARKEPSGEANYGDDLDFAATVAAGLQDTGFNPSIVIDDPSFRRRNSPPGSEDGDFGRGPTAAVTEITSDVAEPSSPPHGFVEEIPEQHMPGSFDGSFDDFKEHGSQAHVEPFREDPQAVEATDKRDLSAEELTGPSDNAGVEPHVYSVEPVPAEPGALGNAAIDPIGEKSYKERNSVKPEKPFEELTEPSDNAHVEPRVYTTEPESFGSSTLRDVTVDPTEGEKTEPVAKETSRAQSPSEENTYSSPDKVDYPSDDISVAATAPISLDGRQGSKSNKKAKRRSVGFDDSSSAVSSPAILGTDKQESSGKPEKARKGGIFGLFGKSTESLPESKGSRETPVEANLEDFEEPKKRSKKSKNRKAALDDDGIPTVVAEPAVFQETEPQEDWSTSKKSKRGKEKRRSSERTTASDSGRITQDLPAQVIAPASPGHDPFLSSTEKLTNLEDPNLDSRPSQSRSGAEFDNLYDRPQAHDDQEPSFLGERPENPPLPDLPDASEDPGGQMTTEGPPVPETSVQPLEHHSDSPTTKGEKQKWRLSDLQADGRSASYSSPSPTAVPLRPLRFGRTPSSPGFSKSLPSTPQPDTTSDVPFTPKRRERPHSTEFRSNEFRPMWLLEKHGSRQEPATPEVYPSLPSSHTTSRASSVHEADDLNLAPEELEEYRFTPGRRGLAIDTSHTIPDSELLDSQQATPTAASFHSMLKEGSPRAEDNVHEIGQSNPELIDVIPPADAYVNPVEGSAQDTRLLHDVKDLLPQRRSSSPSRYDTIIDPGASQQSYTETSRPDEESKERKSGFMSTFKDAALGAFIGGSAATLLKSTSQHDQLSEQPSEQTHREVQAKIKQDLASKPADQVPQRPTAEELRAMQEQDAQDAVDSWFAPAQAKRTKSKKGKKRGQSLEESEQVAVTDPSSQASNEQRVLDTSNQATVTPDEGAHLSLNDAVSIADPKQTVETPQSETPRDGSSTEPSGVDWQEALTIRKDSKSKKKKNKKKASDAWEEKPILPDEPTAEQLPAPPAALQRNLDSEDLVPNKVPSEHQTLTEEPISLSADDKPLPKAGVLPETAKNKEFPTPMKENEKEGKEQQLPYIESIQATAPEDPSIARIFEDSQSINPDTIIELPHVPVAPGVEGIGPADFVSGEVPYESLPSTEEKPQIPPDLSTSTEQPLTTEGTHGSDQAPEALEATSSQAQVSALERAANEPSTHALPDSVLETQAVPAINSDDRDLSPSQALDPALSKSQVSPESIPLPLSDDFDLVQPTPDSPVIQPMDVVQPVEPSQSDTTEKLDTLDRGNEPTAAQQSPVLEPTNPVNVADTLVKDSDGASTVLIKAISDLNLPENAMLDPSVRSENVQLEEKAEASKEQVDDGWPTFTGKKGKKGKKGRENRPIEADMEEDPVELRITNVEEPPAQQSEGALTTDNIPAEQALPTVEVSSLGDERMDDKEGVDEAVGKARLQTFEEDAEWPTMTKKKKKGKKSKRVQFDEPQELQSQQPEVSSASEIPSATTSTAEDVENLLRGSKPEESDVGAEVVGSKEVLDVAPDLNAGVEERPAQSREQREEGNFLEAEKPAERDIGGEKTFDISPTDTLDTPPSLRADTVETVADQVTEQLEQVSLEKSDQPAEEQAAASTETASQVQNILAKEQEQEASALTGRDVEDLVQTEEVDEFAWASSKKKKKGKKSKSGDDTVVAAVERPEIAEALASTEGEASIAKADEPAEEFSSKKSKKDKKSKRNKLSRSASDIQDEQPQSTPIIEESRQEEVTAFEDAPSFQGQIDQLSSIEIPTTQEATHTEIAYDTLTQPSATAPATSAADVSDVVETKEMELSAEAPSVTEKHEQLPSIELPTSPKAVLEEALTFDPPHPTSAPNANIELEAPTAGPEDVINPPVESEAGTLPVEGASSPNDLQEKTISDAVLSPQEVNDQLLVNETQEPLKTADTALLSEDESTGRSINENADQPIASALDTVEPAFQPPPSKKDKKKAKKAKELQWDDEPLTEESTQKLQPVDEPTTTLAEEPNLEPSFEAPAKTKKDRKKSKKAKAFDWNDAEPSSVPEHPDEVIKPGSEQLEQDTTVLDTSSSPPEAVAGEESANVAPVNEAIEEPTEEPTKERDASVPEDDHPAPSIQLLREITEPQQETTESTPNLSTSPANEEDIQEASSMPKSKKDKKKAKKAKALTLEDDLPEMTTEIDESKQAGESNELDRAVVKDDAAIAEEVPKSKKDKKKAKKSKAPAWEDVEPTISSRDEIQQQVAVDVERQLLEEQSRDVAETQIEKSAETPLDEEPAEKKGKKKAKKSKFVAWDEEASMPPSRDETDQLPPASVDEEIVAEPSREEKEREIAEVPPALEDQGNSKKGKKKGKKSKFLAWDEEPSVSSPRDESEPGPGGVGSETIESAAAAQNMDKNDVTEDTEVFAPTLQSKKDKKKAKKAKALAWEEEEAAPLSLPEPAISESNKDIVDQSLEPVEAPETGIVRGIDEPTPAHAPDERLDETVSDEPVSIATSSTGPAAINADEPVQIVTPLPREDAGATGDRLPVMAPDNRSEQAAFAPTDNIEITNEYLPTLPEHVQMSEQNSSATIQHDAPELEPESTILDPSNIPSEIPPDTLSRASDAPIAPPSIDDALKATEEAIPLPSDENIENISRLPEADVKEPSDPFGEEIRDTFTQANDVHTEPVPAPPTEAALNVAEEVSIPPPSNENLRDPSSLPEAPVPEHSDIATAPTVIEALDTAEKVIPLPSNEVVEDLSAPQRTSASEEAEQISAPTATDALKTVEEQIAPTPPEHVKLETDLDLETPEQLIDPAAVPEAESVDVTEEFPLMTSKDKKKAKKAKRAKEGLGWGDEPAESMTPAESDPTLQGIDKAIEEPTLPVGPGAVEVVDDFPMISKKDKKKVKKGKKAFTIDEEPSDTATPVTSVPGTSVLDQFVEDPVIPAESSVAEAFNDASFTSKERKKAKKNKKGIKSEDEPSATPAPAEQEPPAEVLDEVTGETALPDETSTPAEELPVVNKKEKKKGKKGKKVFSFDDEPSESTTPAEPDLNVDLVENPAVSAATSAAAAIEEASAMSKKDKKKAKKAKKAFAFDDSEPSGTATPIQPDNEKDPVDLPMEEPALATETNIPENPENIPSMGKKEMKKGKKGKKASAWEDNDADTATLGEEAEPVDYQPQVVASTLLPVPEVEDGEDLGSSVHRNISPEPAAPTEPIDESAADHEVPEEAERDLTLSDKKSKKDKKKAKKAQVLDWEDDAVATESPSAEIDMDSSIPAGERDPEPTEVRAVEDTTGVLEYEDPVATELQHEGVQEIPPHEPLVPATPFKQGLAPRHEDPAATVETAEHVEPTISSTTEDAYPRPDALETPSTAAPEGPFQPQGVTESSSATQESFIQPSTSATRQVTEEAILPAIQETPISQEDDFTSFAPAKKSKKGKKAKKQTIPWEEDTSSPSAPTPEPKNPNDDMPAQVRPEMASWPTEVRLNQSEGALHAEAQPSSATDVIHDQDAADAQSPVPEPLEPALVADERSDYFGYSPNNEVNVQTQTVDNEADAARTALTPDVAYEDPHPKDEASIIRHKTPATVIEPEATVTHDKQFADTAESSRPQDAAAEPADDFEGFAFKKKSKKSKRKQKQQVVEDVMWEFPSMDPPAPPPEAEQVVSEHAPNTNDLTTEKQTHEATSTTVLPEEPTHIESASFSQDGLPRDAKPSEQGDTPTDDDTRARIQSEPTIPEEPRLEEAAEDEWGPVSKKGKKSKGPKNRGVEQDNVPPQQPSSATEPEAPKSFEDGNFEDKEPEVLGKSEQLSREDEPPVDSQAKAGEAMATAAAMSAGIIAAENLGRMESKKSKKNRKSRQASSTWDEPEQVQQPSVEPSNEVMDGQAQSRASTPERRRSPIQAWHQYISPSQSPKQSELYEVKNERPRSATSTRRKRSYDEDKTQVPSSERRSPIEAWHQYNTPRHSPQQSETYDYPLRHDDSQEEHPISKTINRDSAVHVSDSPVVPDRSPVHRSMRDSGYPDTEASPLVGVGSEHQDRPHEENIDGARTPRNHQTDSMEANPLNITSDHERQQEREISQSLPRWGSDHENVNLPKHTVPPTRSFEDLREPSPVSSTTNDRSSMLFESSPSTREQQVDHEQRQRASHHQEGQDAGHSPHAALRALHPPREDNSEIVQARAESLAALSGLRETDQGQQRPSLFGGPVGISSDGTNPATPADDESTHRRRLNTITEYSPEESPLHKKNRHLSDVGSPDRGVKTARRSGTPQAIQKRRASSPAAGHVKGMISTDDVISRLSWPEVDEEKHSVDMERSRSRGPEQRPTSHQSNISSLVSGPPKQREYERRSLSGASNRSIESINAIIRTPPDQMRSASGMSNRSSGTPPLRRTDRSVSGDLRGAKRKSEAKKRAKPAEAEDEIPPPPPPSSTTHESAKDASKSRVREMADVFVSADRDSW